MNDATPGSLYSEIDSKRFEIRIGRAQITHPGELATALESTTRESLRMLIVRCATDDFPTIHGLEAAGARLMDTLVYYQRSLRKDALPEELRPNATRAAQDADLPDLRDLVGEIFRGFSGHYHVDPRLDRTRADEGYVEWASQMLLQRNPTREVLVAEDADGGLAGFACMRLNDPHEGEGVLFGVHPSAVRRGLYWSFMVQAMQWCQRHGAVRMIVSTQLTNLAVQKNWARLGFELSRSYYTFHLWRD